MWGIFSFAGATLIIYWKSGSGSTQWMVFPRQDALHTLIRCHQERGPCSEEGCPSKGSNWEVDLKGN